MALVMEYLEVSSVLQCLAASEAMRDATSVVKVLNIAHKTWPNTSLG